MKVAVETKAELNIRLLEETGIIAPPPRKARPIPSKKMTSFDLTLYDYRFKTTEGKRINTMKIQTSLVVTQKEIDRRDNDPDWHFDHTILRSREAASRYLDRVLMEFYKGNTLSSGVISDIDRPLRFCYPSEQAHYRNELTRAGIIK